MYPHTPCQGIFRCTIIENIDCSSACNSSIYNDYSLYGDVCFDYCTNEEIFSWRLDFRFYHNERDYPQNLISEATPFCEEDLTGLNELLAQESYRFDDDPRNRFRVLPTSLAIEHGPIDSRCTYWEAEERGNFVFFDQKVKWYCGKPRIFAGMCPPEFVPRFPFNLFVR